MRGEDYDFQFSGRVREGKLHFRLNMEYVGDDEDADGNARPPDPPPPPHPRCRACHPCACLPLLEPCLGAVLTNHWLLAKMPKKAPGSLVVLVVCQPRLVCVLTCLCADFLLTQYKAGLSGDSR